MSCYWYGALLRYGELYFAEETDAQKRVREENMNIVNDDYADEDEKEEEEDETEQEEKKTRRHQHRRQF